ncbi:MAG: hypothetical protein KDB62_08285 [Solirubrobacterales bacterium]|nr:hypothetical protein [Solirubrobacterales bacterium]
MAPVTATAILCDSAQTADGKLYLMGGGWTRLAANTAANMALGIIVHVPFDMSNRQLPLVAELLDDDGRPVEIEGNRVRAEGQFELGRPAGLKQGEQMSTPFAMNFRGLNLPPGGYVFEISIQDEPAARCPFRVA